MKRLKVKCGGFLLPTFNLFILTLTLLLLSSNSLALAYPDTAELKKTHRVVSRDKDGRPVLLSRILDGDSMSVVLDWRGGKVAGVRLEQEDPWESLEFTRLTESYGDGAAWHEHPGSAGGKPPLPGLEQQWFLKGYGGATGWLGSGTHKGRFFLAFADDAPSGLSRVEAPLALRPQVRAFLDTSSRWLKVPCRDGEWPAVPGQAPRKPAGKPVCYRSNEDTRLAVRFLRKSPLLLEVRFDEGESDALKEIRRVVQTVPDASQAEYARDLSALLLAESQIFLAKLGRALPDLFNWPSWQLQGLKQGQVPADRFLSIVRSELEPGDTLPALLLEAENLRLAINLYYKGTFQLEAEERK